MTAPFAPPPPPLFWAVMLGFIAMFIAITFGRRAGWAGSAATLVVVGFAIFLWAALIVGLLRRFIEWYRGEE